MNAGVTRAPTLITLQNHPSIPYQTKKICPKVPRGFSGIVCIPAPAAGQMIRQTLHLSACNGADMRVGDVRQFCSLQPEEQSLMRAPMTQLNLPAGVYHRTLKSARTIADLAGSEGYPVRASGRHPKYQ